MNRNGWNDWASQAGSWVLETARTKPEAVLLLGAGCALLLRSATSLARGGDGGGSTDYYAEATGAASHASDQASRYGSDLRDQASRYGSDMRDQASSATAGAFDTMRGYASSARETVGSTLQETIARVVRDEPFIVAAMGLAAGALTAALLPRTEIEDETFGDLGAQLSQTAVETGERLRGAAVAAGGRFRDSAQEHGFSADGLKEMAREAAETFAAAAKPGETAGGAQSGGSHDTAGSQHDTSGSQQETAL